MKNKKILNLYWLAVLIGFISISLISFLILKNLFFRDLIYTDLPKETTIAALEWTSDHTANELKSVSKLLDFPTTVQIVNFDLTLLSQSIPSSTVSSLIAASPNINSKAIILTKVDQQIIPVFAYRFNKAISKKLSLKGLAYTKIDTTLFVSINKKAIENLLVKASPVKSLLNYQDAISNIPKYNIADFYLNHDLLEPNDLQNYLGLFQDFNQKLGVTVGALKADNNYVYFSTYTNESKKSKQGFPVTRNKYQAKLLNTVPADTKLFFSGVNVSERVNKLFNSPDFAVQILNILNSYNLSPEALKLLVKVLNNEFAITLNGKNQISFIASDLSTTDQQVLKAELARLAEFFDPVVEPYKLGDGTMANVLVPSNNYEPTKISDTEFKYFLKKINNNLYLSNLNSYFGNLTVLSTHTPYNNTNSILEFEHVNNMLSELLPIADEVLYIDSNLIYPYLNTILDKQDIPNIMTSSNFFTDGIQTVTILKW